jgi:hypothetical protein
LKYFSGFKKKPKRVAKKFEHNNNGGAIDLAELTHFNDWRKNPILLIESKLAYVLRSRF